MKKYIKQLIPIIILGTALTSCQSDDLDSQNFKTFDTPSVHFEQGSESFLESDINIIPVVAFYSDVNHDSDVTATVNIEGNAVDYSLVDSDLTYRFPAGVYSDTIFVKLNNNFDTEENRDIVFNIASVSNNAIVGYPGNDMVNGVYTLTILDDDCPYTLQELGEATWSGTDNVPSGEAGPNTSKITTSFVNGKLMMEGIAYAWLTDPDYWDEVIVESYPVEVEVADNGGITIPLQPLAKTTWKGDPQPMYSIAATGLYESCSNRMTINYDLYQGGEILKSYTEIITK